MDARLSEPTKESSLYSHKALGVFLDSTGLKETLGNIERDLDALYETRLATGEIAMFGYSIRISYTSSKRTIGHWMIGGIILKVKEGMKFVLPEFRREYKDMFKEAVESLEKPSSLNILARVTGSRDSIERIVEAQDPNSR